MRIMYIISSMIYSHGTEQTLSDKINYLSAKGHDVSLVTYEQSGKQYAFELNNQVNCYDCNCCFYKVYNYSRLIRPLKYRRLYHIFQTEIRAIYNKCNPDVIVTTTYDVEAIHALSCLELPISLICESHVSYVSYMKGGSILQKYRNALLLRRLRKFNLLIALSNADLMSWSKKLNHVIKINNPISYYPDSICESKKIIGRILAVGRLCPQKRFDRLINAFALIKDNNPDWFIDIFGDGEDEDMLNKQIKEMGLEGRVNLKGVTSNIFSEYECCEMFVLSSDYEGFPLVLLEAMACGTPVISTDCPHGASELIDNGITGLLCKMEVEDLAEKMEWMMNHKEERKRIGSRARQSVAKYKKDVVMKMWEKAYEEACENA